VNEASSPEPATLPQERVLPFEKVVLVLQGGGALGAYQAGVFAALAEANIHVDWVCGISIGAINGALIAGNPREKRVERLRQFWEAVTQPPVSFPGLPWFSDPPWEYSDSARAWANRISAAATLLYGAPNFFSPRPVPPFNISAEKPDAVSFYDTAPLQSMIMSLVDFDLINTFPMRLSVGATNVRTGASVYFDNIERKIALSHVMASASLPPAFPPTEVDGDYYWDGGVISNSAMQVVLERPTPYPVHSAIVFEVDLWDANGEVPRDITGANLRAMEIHGASRVGSSLQEYRKTQRFRRALGRLLSKVPEATYNDPEFQLLVEESATRLAMLVRLKYQARKYEGASKVFDFSRRAMEEHWQAGYEDTSTALHEPAVLELPDPMEAARVFDVHYGWEK